MTGFWAERTVLITGGGGFLGRAVRRAVERRDPARVLCPSSADYDLREAAQVTAMLDDHRPDVVIHLAARVGGIGANLERPADLYLDNLLMGTHVLEATRRADTAKTVIVGTICSYPKFTPVPFEESSLWQGYPEETNAPYGIAKLAQLVQLQANRAQYGQSAIYLMPTNLYGPGDKFHPSSRRSSRNASTRSRPGPTTSTSGAPEAPAANSCTSTTPPRASRSRRNATTTPTRSIWAPTKNDRSATSW